MSKESMLTLIRAYEDFWELNKVAVAVTGAGIDFIKFRGLWNIFEVILEFSSISDGETLLDILQSDISTEKKYELIK